MKARSDHDESPLGYAHGMRNVPLKSRLEAEAKRRADNAQTGPSPTPSLLRVTLPLRLLTPIIGGGVKTMTPDPTQPVRVTALRGALRWWWRALQPTADLDKLKADERLLFGGVARPGVKGDDNVPSLVRVGVSYGARARAPANTTLASGLTAGLEYALFPLSSIGQHGDGPPKVIEALELDLTLELDREALRARVRASLGANATEEKVTEDANDRAASVVAALRWWLHWGGVGARTRRGFGAVGLRSPAVVTGGEALGEALNLHALPAPPVGSAPPHRPTLFGAKVLRDGPSSGEKDAAQAHRRLISALSELRQGVGYARDVSSRTTDPNRPRPGETRWPEAELMKHRRANNSQHLNHRQRVSPQERPLLSAPRAAFGLPIVMHFKDQGDRQASGEIIPVEPWRGVTTDRWASPLLLRPQLHSNGQVRAGVLILTGAALPREVEVKGARGQKALTRGVIGARGPVAEDLNATGGDALTAFSRRIQRSYGFKPEPA